MVNKNPNCPQMLAEAKYLKPYKFHILLVLIYLLIFLFNGFQENIRMDLEIKRFVEKATFEREEIYNGNKIKFYKVSRETLQEKPVIYYNNGYYLGSNGDIFLSKISPFPYLPLFHEAFGYFFGGHASVVTNYDINGNKLNYSQFSIEINGKEEDNRVRYTLNNWFDTKTCIGVRIKNVDDKAFTDCLKSKLGYKYNYTYVFNTKNKYYCTDLVSRTAAEVGYNLNDGFITSVNDLFLSKDTYIIYYQYVSNNIKYVYYLG